MAGLIWWGLVVDGGGWGGGGGLCRRAGGHFFFFFFKLIHKEAFFGFLFFPWEGAITHHRGVWFAVVVFFLVGRTYLPPHLQ